MRWVALALWFIILAVIYDAQAQGIPSASKAHKRAYISAVQSVWGLTQPAWLAAQVEAESAWIDGQVSSANARGLCQFIPATARGLEAQYPGLTDQVRYSPYWCYYAQSLLMRDLYKSFTTEDREPCEILKFATAGYNGSPTTLRKEINLCLQDPDCDPDRWDENVATKNARRIDHYKESRGYVARITRREPVYVQDFWGVGVCVK